MGNIKLENFETMKFAALALVSVVSAAGTIKELQPCDSKADGKGCESGLRCADTKVPIAGKNIEICIKEELCDTEKAGKKIECSAMKMATTALALGAALMASM